MTTLSSLSRLWRRPKSLVRRLTPVCYGGCRFVPLVGDEICDKLRGGLAYEAAELQFLVQFVQPGNVFYDIGANFGLFTVLASRKITRSGRILAVEPDPRNRRRLRLNLALNPYSRVTVAPFALADEPAEVTFASCSEGAYSGLRIAKVPGTVQTITVKQTTLDALTARFRPPRVDFVKMDVEGAELFVLRGGQKFFGDWPRPVIMCEFSDRRTVAFNYQANQIYTWLADRGYRWFSLQQGCWLTPQAPKEFYDYDNLIACPQDKLPSLERWMR